MEKVSVTCRLEPASVAFLDQLASATERDRSYLIKKAVETFIANERWQIEEVQAAQAEMAAGQVVSEAELAKQMKTW